MAEPRRDRISRADELNREAREHLRQTAEFLRLAREQLESIKGDVARNRDHLQESERFRTEAERYLHEQRSRRRGL